jgi:hypothetical protein
MLVGLAATGHTSLLDDLVSPGLLLQVLVGAAIAGLLLGTRAANASRRSGSSLDDGAELREATQRTRRWTLLAMEAPLVYAASRVLMFLQVPGFRDEAFDLQLRLAGLGLAAASVVGAVLTWGLIRPWGERFPRWLPVLSGRRVPVDLAVVPALVVAAMILAASRALAVGAVQADADAWRDQVEAPLVGLPQVLWPVWGVALALAALSYQRRRRIADRVARAQPGVTSARAAASTGTPRAGRR